MSKAEKFIEANTRNCSQLHYNSACTLRHCITPDQALEAVKIAREEELEYVKYQLELRLPETLDYNGVQVDRKDFINDFIKAMKGE